MKGAGGETTGVPVRIEVRGTSETQNTRVLVSGRLDAFIGLVPDVCLATKALGPPPSVLTEPSPT